MGAMPFNYFIASICVMRHRMWTARLGLLSLARLVYTVNEYNNIFHYAEICDPRLDQTLQKILENKTDKYSELKAILKNTIAKILKVA